MTGIGKKFGTSNVAPALWRSRPRLFNNPVILRELVAHLRKKSSFLYLFLFLSFWMIAASRFLYGRTLKYLNNAQE